MPIDENTSATLQEIEDDDWGEPPFTSHVVTETHRLRRVPLRDFTIENCRLMIGQGFSLEYVLLVAFKYLEEDPLAEGDYYPGDLLRNVLRLDRSFWVAHPRMKARLDAVLERVEHPPEDVREALEAYLKES